MAVGADLVVSTLTAPAAGGAGATLSVSDTTKNQGGGPAPASVTQFFFSTNTVLDGTDTLLGSRSVPPLAASATSTATTSLTIPPGTTAGNYYILARSDGEGLVPETNEANNTRSVFVAIGADLAVTALVAPAEASAGATIAVTDTTKNQGGGAGGASLTQFFLSANAVLDGTDIPLGARSVPALGPGATSALATSLTLPPNMAAGTYYILALADGGAVVPETNESNNTRAAVVALGADLVVTTLTVPAAAGAGGPIAVSDTTKNQGGGATGASVTRFYLSQNAVLDASDVLLGDRAVPPLAVDASSSGSSSFVLPQDLVAGNYYVLARADDAGVVPETNEANNTRTALVVIGPDLVVTALTAPASAGAGGTIAVSDTTKNQGAGGASASRTSFYLSVNAAFDAQDVLLGSRDVPALAATVSSTASTNLTLPANTVAGGYYILARADDAGGVPETSEANNTRAAYTAVGPDLVVAALTVPATAKSGSAIAVSDTTRNLGGGGATSSQTRFYLSTNAVLDDSDVLLGSRAVPALGPAATSVTTTSLSLPAGIAPQFYYVLAKADGDEGTLEVNEANNTRAAGVTISSP